MVASNYNGPALPAGVQKLDNEIGIAGDGQNTLEPRIGFAWRFRAATELFSGLATAFSASMGLGIRHCS